MRGSRMPLEFLPQPLDGVVLIEPRVAVDERGWFLEAFRQSEFDAAGIATPFVQDNLSSSSRGVLRGIHYQLPPHAQAKLVSVVRGAIWDVCVDLRRGSPTLGHWLGRELNDANHHMLYIPPGYGHGFVVLSEWAEVAYKCTAEYCPSSERGVRWDDPTVGIAWPVRDVVVSAKDAAQPLLAGAALFEAVGS